MLRIGGLICAVVVVVVVGMTGGGESDSSVTASVKDFLVAWQYGHYRTAASMTDGRQTVVARTMKDAFEQLGAENLSLSMGPIHVTGRSAHAYFYASFDLGRGGLPWNYRGQMKLRQVGSRWLVVWSPSVITPGLGRHDRLAVLTTLPPRAQLLGANGKSLIPPSPAIEVGVIPDKVANPRRTARDLARATGLAQPDADEMAAQIMAAPPDTFLELVQLSPSTFARLSPVLAKVPGITHQTRIKPLFGSTVPEITGRIGTETAKVLIQDGDSYLPGTTVGLSGLQQFYQSALVGTPSTEVVVQNAAGRQVKVLKRWPGKPSTSVRTTIDSGVQRAARQATDSAGLPAAVVAVKASTGQILGVAAHATRGMPTPSPLAGRYMPGQAFTMVSTAAVLASEPGFGAGSPVPCSPTQHVNGQTFGNVPAEPRLGKPLFSTDFAHACSTAFAALSLYLTPSALTSAGNAFGIGAPWHLPIAAFAGGMQTPASSSSQALPADAVGTGTDRVSPLDMALAAGVVDSGSWHQPSLTGNHSKSTLAQRPVLKSRVINLLRQLMRESVSKGAASAARVRGTHLYGQVGSAPVPGHRGLKAIWFAGYRGDVAFAVLVFSRSSSFAPAVAAAHQFVTALPPGA